MNTADAENMTDWLRYADNSVEYDSDIMRDVTPFNAIPRERDDVPSEPPF